MKKVLLFFLLSSVSLVALAQYGRDEKDASEPFDPIEAAYKEASVLEERLELQPHQVFYVDSILQSNLTGLRADMDILKSSGITEVTAFKQIQQKWQVKIDSAYAKIFTEDQMVRYLKYKGRYKKDKKK